MQKWDNTYRSADLQDKFSDFEAQPDVTSWSGVESFLSGFNKDVRRRRRKKAALWMLPLLVIPAVGISLWYSLPGESMLLQQTASIQSMPEKAMTDVPAGENNLQSNTQQQDLNSMQGTNPEKESGQKADNPVHQSAARVTVDPEKALAEVQETEKNTDVRSSQVISSADVPTDMPLFAASLPASQIMNGMPAVTPAAFEIPETKNAVKRYKLHVEPFYQLHPEKIIASAKTLPVETSQTLGSAMVFVPGTGLIFSRPEFSNPHQFGAGLLFDFSKRFSADVRGSYYTVNSIQESNYYKGHQAYKRSSFSSGILYTGVRFHALNSKFVKVYLNTGLSSTFALANSFRIDQYLNGELINEHKQRDKVSGNSLNVEGALGVSVHPVQRIGIFAEFDAQRGFSEIHHLNAPSFFRNFNYSLRTGIKLSLY
jgi:hypothetical protein